MKIRTIIALVAMACVIITAPVAEAQSYNQTQAGLASTFNIAETSTNTTAYLTNGSTIYVTKALDVAIQARFKLVGAGTSACVFTLGESADGVYWRTGTRTFTITASTTNVVSLTTNFTVGAVGFLRLEGITNPNATVMTNIVLQYAYKTP